MKALSLSQPMAWSVFHGKDIENRDWRTKVRGRVIIHAAQSWNQEHWEWLVYNRQLLDIELPGYRDPVFVAGALIGEVDIVDCVDHHPSKWFFGKWGFVLANQKAYSNPIPFKGSILFFDVPSEIIRR